MGGGPLAQAPPRGNGRRVRLLHLRPSAADLRRGRRGLGPPLPGPVLVQLLLPGAALLQQRGGRARHRRVVPLGALLFVQKNIIIIISSSQGRQGRHGRGRVFGAFSFSRGGDLRSVAGCLVRRRAADQRGSVGETPFSPSSLV